MASPVNNRDTAMARLRWSAILLSAAGAFASFGSLTELYFEGRAVAVAVAVGLAASVLAFVGMFSVLFSNLVFAHQG